MKRQVLRFLIQPADAGQRIDQVLPRYDATLSRTRLRKLIDIGGVHLAGRRVSQCSRPVQGGQQVEIFIDGLPLDSWALKPDLILYQDRFLLVLNKPAGIDTQPTPARFKGTIYHALQKYLEGLQPNRDVSLGMVQRLDRGTSGAMVFSIHKAAHKGLTEALNRREIDKRYLAMVTGDLVADQGEFNTLLARNRATNLVKSVARGGKQAITRFRVLARMASSTLVEVDLLTGRTHQIRAHFAEAGHPLLGDTRYGGPDQLAGHCFEHPMLHAWQLGLQHPIERTALRFQAPVPHVWQQVWQLLGGRSDELRQLISTAGEVSSLNATGEEKA
jgi:23S rRNA pseudouridine1911/1915/1917 synthase